MRYLEMNYLANVKDSGFDEPLIPEELTLARGS
jgi:hypothetical protein